MSECCPTCKREFDKPKDFTTVELSVTVKVAPGAGVMRSHVVDIVHEAMLDWMHEDTWSSIPPGTAQTVVDTIIARAEV
jgi:hypothetical protein